MMIIPKTAREKKKLRIEHCQKMLIEGISFIISDADDQHINLIELHFTKGWMDC